MQYRPMWNNDRAGISKEGIEKPQNVITCDEILNSSD